MQDLWQADYHILLIILIKEFIKLNVNIVMITKNAKLVELNAKIASLEHRNVKKDLIERKCLFCNKNYQKNSL